MIIDVDCTDEKAKKLCETFGVQGYPTLKYFGPMFSDDGEKYEEARDYKALASFVKKTSKKPCVPSTLENCDKKEKAYLEEIKELGEDKLKEQMLAWDTELSELKEKEKAEKDLFEKQKDEAMATMKKSEDLKKKLTKMQDKVGYKIQILNEKTKKKEEL